MEKSLDELRAAIIEDQEEANTDDENTGTQSNVESKAEDASEDEGTSNEASDDTHTEGTSEGEEEWVVPGRFKTQADVLKAYSELESFTGRQSSEIQKLRTSIAEPLERGESAEEKAVRLKRFADELASDPEAALDARMRKVMGEVKGDVKASEFKRVYDARVKDTASDFAELEPIMANIATQYGDMIMAEGLQNDPRLLDILHLAARGVHAAEIAKEAAIKGAKKGEDNHRRKGKAKIEGPSSTTKTKKLDISKLSSSEMKAAFEKGDLSYDE